MSAKKFLHALMRMPVVFLVTILLSIHFWLPVPAGLAPKTWLLFLIFIGTIGAIILQPLPMGAISLISLAICCATKVLTTKQALAGFASDIVWLVVLAFLLARGFIKTGLGSRLAYYFLSVFGGNVFGISGSLQATEILLAPFIPSNTARGAGVVFPIAKAICAEYNERRFGGYLIQICAHSNLISSAMFLTAMAANPCIVKVAESFGLNISWLLWAKYAIIPGLISLVALPVVLYLVHSPGIFHTPEIKQYAKVKLTNLGPITVAEWKMLIIFLALLVLWATGAYTGLSATAAAMLGVGVMLMLRVLSWQDILEEGPAWDALIWLGVLINLSSYLLEFGMVDWLDVKMQGLLGGMSWQWGLLGLILFYYYSHYFFASLTAHVAALFALCAKLAIGLGAPALLTVMSLGFASSLCASTTHYGSGPTPVYFAAGYLSFKEWWRLGFIVSVLNLLIWSTAGLGWWNYLGLG